MAKRSTPRKIPRTMADQAQEQEQEHDDTDEEQGVIDTQIRTHKALLHMEKVLQLPNATVAPVLLQLVKAYDGKWQFIEENNYHVLVDAIFSTQESDEAEKAPGSSSGGARRGRKKEKRPVRGAPRRAPRNSKRVESDGDGDDSDENGGSQELVRRTRARGPASTATPIASGETWGDAVLALPEPLRTAPPQPQHQVGLPSATLARLRRLSAGKSIEGHPATAAVNKETQTDADCFIPEAIQFKEPMSIAPTALICYPGEPFQAIPFEDIPFEEVPAEEDVFRADNSPAERSDPRLRIPRIPKQEPRSPISETPVFLSDLEVRRLLLGHAAPEICKTCEKPRPKCEKVPFDPSKVKAEPHGSDAPMSPPPMQCFNPEPLLAMVPMPLPPDADMEFEVTDRAEPLLLTFPATEPDPETTPIVAELVAARVISEPDAATKAPAIVELVVAPVSPALVAAAAPARVRSVADEPLRASSVPGSPRKPAIDAGSCPQPVPSGVPDWQRVAVPSEPASMEAMAVEGNPGMESGLLPTNEGVARSAETWNFLSPKAGEPEQELRPQQSGGACANSGTQGALAALGSYISESDDLSDVDMLPKQGLSLAHSHAEVVSTSAATEKRAGAHEIHGILPVARIASTTNFAEQSKDSWVVVEVKQTLPTALVPSATTNMLQQHDEAASDGSGGVAAAQTRTQEPVQPNSKQRHEGSPEGDTSSESCRKRKRPLTKLKDLATKSQANGLQAPDSHHHGLDSSGTAARARRYDCRDMSRGKERVPVSIAIDASASGNNAPPALPPDFCYLKASVVYQSAHVGISMARIGEDDRCSGCVGDCLDNQVPCECARLTDGEFAYTVEGCLYPHFLRQEIERKRSSNVLSYCQPGACPVERTNDEVCRGHVQRRFIKECWEKCGCAMGCGNRTVQRGLTHKLQVFWTGEAKGWGVRTLEPLRAGTFVCEYVGEILTNTEMWHRNNDVHGDNKHHFSLQLDADWCSERYLKDEEALCLDGTCFGNVARFINHRCFDANLIEIPVEIENPDHHYYHLAFFTSKDVEENEELTWDYGLDFYDEDHPVQAFECSCGSTHCRGKAEGNLWM